MPPEISKFRSFKEVETFLLMQLPMFSRVGAAALKPSLDNIYKLCALAGNPQKAYKIIHVAGTNGKGTVSHLIAGFLQSQGYKVGLHTSPHYKDLRERMKVNGRLPPKGFIVDFMNNFRSEIIEIQPSFFEITVVMSFSYFYAQNVDFAVVEVGLGGRLDSTNVVDPILSIITNISLDHTELLGGSIQEIAKEKAGIIKYGIPVLIGEQQNETTPIFEEVANKMSAMLTYAEDIMPLKILSSSLTSTNIELELRQKKIALNVDITGPFQFRNFTTAFAACSILIEKGVRFDEYLLASFFQHFRANTKYFGRWQVISKKPMVLVDSAHNEGGMHYVLNQLKMLHLDKLHIVIGFVADKNRKRILADLPKNALYYFAKADIPRGLDANILKNEAREFGLIGEACESVAAALQLAKKRAHENDLIFVGGSIFIVAEVI